VIGASWGEAGNRLLRRVSARRPFRKESLPERSPFMDCPKREPAYGLLQYGYVIGDQQKAQGQHPQSQKRHDREDPAKDEAETAGNPNPSRIRMGEAAKDTSDLARHLMLQTSERLPQNGSSVFVSHALSKDPSSSGVPRTPRKRSRGAPQDQPFWTMDIERALNLHPSAGARHKKNGFSSSRMHFRD
jgi:hypothetical protein